MVRGYIYNMNLGSVPAQRVVTESLWERSAHEVLKYAINGLAQLRIQRFVVAEKLFSRLYCPFRQGSTLQNPEEALCGGR